MSNRFVDNVTPLNAETLNKFEADLKSYAGDAGGKTLYLHKVQITQGTDSNKMIGLINVYTHSSSQLNSVASLAAALGVTNVTNMPMGGRYDIVYTSYRYYNMTSSAFISSSSITLRGYQIGLSDAATGVVTFLDGSGTLTITDDVSAVS